MRKIILNLAMSIDGKIVDENYGFSWIYGDGNKSNDTKYQFDFESFLNSCDTLIFGKKAYDDLPRKTFDLFFNKKIIVLTHSSDIPKTKNIEFYNGNLNELVRILKIKNGKNIWVFGGASVCNILIKEDLIDEYIIGIIPVIVGKGKRLFEDDNPMLRLKIKNYSISEGITILEYYR